jgi:hypothetical protein
MGLPPVWTERLTVEVLLWFPPNAAEPARPVEVPVSTADRAILIGSRAAETGSRGLLCSGKFSTGNRHPIRRKTL